MIIYLSTLSCEQTALNDFAPSENKLIHFELFIFVTEDSFDTEKKLSEESSLVTEISREVDKKLSQTSSVLTEVSFEAADKRTEQLERVLSNNVS